jgi:hypothetical protein
MFKKILTVAAILAVLAVLVPTVQAQGIYTRADGTAVLNSGSGVYTNSRTYEPLELKRIWVYGSAATNNVVTVTRVDAGGAITQSVGSVATGTLLTGNTATFTAGYLYPGDWLVFSSSLSTGYTFRVESEVQR